jgi:hypothetical protein
MAYLAGMIQQSNCALVDDLSEYKNYVINKYVYEIEHTEDSKIRIQALTKLGEVDGVDAFKKRTEITHVIKPIEEVENELLEIHRTIKLRKEAPKAIEMQPEDYEVVDYPPDSDKK